MSENNKRPIVLTELFPDLPEEQRLAAEAQVRRYLELIKRIYEHVSRQDPKLLTELRQRARLRKKGEKSA